MKINKICSKHHHSVHWIHERPIYIGVKLKRWKMKNLVLFLNPFFLYMLLLYLWNLLFWLLASGRSVAFLHVDSALVAVIPENNFCCWDFYSKLSGCFCDSNALILHKFEQFASFLDRKMFTTYEILEYLFLASKFLMLI